MKTIILEINIEDAYENKAEQLLFESLKNINDLTFKEYHSQSPISDEQIENTAEILMQSENLEASKIILKDLLRSQQPQQPCIVIPYGSWEEISELYRSYCQIEMHRGNEPLNKIGWLEETFKPNL